MEIQHQEYLTFSKAAVLIGCSRQYIYKLVTLGKLKASRISNRMAFIRKTDLVNDERYYTVEQVRQIYGLSSANISHIVKVKHIEKIKVGVKKLLLRSDVERVMAEREK